VSVRVSPIEGIRDEIHGLFGSGRQLSDVLEDVARLSVRLVIQSVWETEVGAFLERDRYQRREDGSPAGSRNGYQPPSTIKTTLGRSRCAARNCGTRWWRSRRSCSVRA